MSTDIEIMRKRVGMEQLEVDLPVPLFACEDWGRTKLSSQECWCLVRDL